MVHVIETAVMKALMDVGYGTQHALSRAAYLSLSSSPHYWQCPPIPLLGWPGQDCSLNCIKCWRQYLLILKEKIESEGYEVELDWSKV